MTHRLRESDVSDSRSSGSVGSGGASSCSGSRCTASGWGWAASTGYSEYWILCRLALCRLLLVSWVRSLTANLLGHSLTSPACIGLVSSGGPGWSILWWGLRPGNLWKGPGSSVGLFSDWQRKHSVFKQNCLWLAWCQPMQAGRSHWSSVCSFYKSQE